MTCENCQIDHNGSYGSGRFCSSKCARGFSTKSKRKQINDSVSKTLSTKSKLGKNLICLHCGNKYYRKPSAIEGSKFCSNSCAMTWKNLNTDIASLAGRASAISQNKNRRSLNEKYFAKLCIEYFDKVLTNEPIFNGWDADVIIEDLKIAVLWNGPWHYIKLTKDHSVLQVQNRDKLKIEEIKKCNYQVYVIKDMGKHNKSFVDLEFKKFIKNICG